MVRQKKGLGFWDYVGSSPPSLMFYSHWTVESIARKLTLQKAGTGLGGVIIPLLLQYLLNTHGFRITLRIWSIVLCIAPLL